MKRAVRGFSLSVGFGLIAVLGLLAVIRLAPTDPAQWHVDLAAAKGDGASYCTISTPGVRSEFKIADPVSVLVKLNEIALGTPRTLRIAGSPQEGRITWITRSALMGFPDFTTAQVLPSNGGWRLCMLARQRFGIKDFGVNARRILTWAMVVEGLREWPEPNPL
ncbi:MAG: DUF1499 domain-containing protein [Paracoccaceae bacterium]|nr:DUF1499 domain-containing protein [Paracoccaceae bacterium]